MCKPLCRLASCGVDIWIFVLKCFGQMSFELVEVGSSSTLSQDVDRDLFYNEQSHLTYTSYHVPFSCGLLYLHRIKVTTQCLDTISRVTRDDHHAISPGGPEHLDVVTRGVEERQQNFVDEAYELRAGDGQEAADEGTSSFYHFGADRRDQMCFQSRRLHNASNMHPQTNTTLSVDDTLCGRISVAVVRFYQGECLFPF